jgi:hypothetical protein
LSGAVVVNSESELYFQAPLKGITVSELHPDSAFTVNFALNFKAIVDVDNFGDMVHSKFILSAILAETSYLEKSFFLIEIDINGVLLSDIFNSYSLPAYQFASMIVSPSCICIFSITVVTLFFDVITIYHSKFWMFISGISHVSSSLKLLFIVL